MDTKPTAYDLFPYVMLHDANPVVKQLVHTNAYAILTSPTIDGELTMQNKIRVHPKRLERMLQDPFWKKMYEQSPEQFEVTDQPADDKETDDGTNDE